MPVTYYLYPCSIVALYLLYLCSISWPIIRTIYWPIYWPIYPSIYLSICLFKNLCIDDSNTRYQVESVQQVVERVSSLVASLESRYSNKHIILTSHADTLQIMQTYLAGRHITTYFLGRWYWHPLNHYTIIIATNNTPSHSTILTPNSQSQLLITHPFKHPFNVPLATLPIYLF